MDACLQPRVNDVIAWDEPFEPTPWIIMNGSLADDNISFSPGSSRHLEITEFARDSEVMSDASGRKTRMLTDEREESLPLN
jgi:hypothetical protein